MLPIANEHELLCSLVEGDHAAFDAIYRQYFHAVYYNALKITRHTALAEDVLQDVFLTLWERRKTIDIHKSIGGWLFVTCYNKAIDQLRKKLHQSLVHQELVESNTETFSDDFSLYKEQWNMLGKAIDQLSPQKRKVFELCKLQGKTYEETAAILDISKYTVKEYLAAAVSFIKEQVRQQPASSMRASLALFLYLFNW